MNKILGLTELIRVRDKTEKVAATFRLRKPYKLKIIAGYHLS